MINFFAVKCRDALERRFAKSFPDGRLNPSWPVIVMENVYEVPVGQAADWWS